MNIVCIILARGGSKGLTQKNIRSLAGVPLIAYSIKAAKNSKLVSRVIVSTDDEEIKNVALIHGAEVPFIRPEEYSDDKATSEKALKHAVEWLKEKESYKSDIVVYVQATSVFRSKNMIDDCIRALIDDSSIDSAFVGIPDHFNYWRKGKKEFYRLASDIPYGTPRQSKEALYREQTGLALATRYDVVMKEKRLGNNCKIIPFDNPYSFIDIHTEFDLWLAEQMITVRNILPNEDL